MAERRRRAFWRTLVLPPLVAFVAAGAVLAVDRETGLPAVLEMLHHVNSAEEALQELEGEYRELIRKVRGLRSDPFEIEAEARARLGMVRPKEVVVRLSGGRYGVD